MEEGLILGQLPPIGPPVQAPFTTRMAGYTEKRSDLIIYESIYFD